MKLNELIQLIYSGSTTFYFTQYLEEKTSNLTTKNILYMR